MTGKRLLLTVGINDYPGSGADLSGCVNDSYDIAAALGERGYVTTQLLDAQATKPAVEGALIGLVAALRRGDRLVVHYSGHGSNVADRDGDEPDGRDECLVLHDYATGGLLLDDELHAILTRKALGSRVLLLMDSCNSGTVSRFLGRQQPADSRVRFLDVDVVTGRSTRPAPALEQQTSRTIAGVTQISGCADAEFSYDTSFDGRPNGAFTYTALQALQRQPRTLGAWYREIRRALPSERFPQTPQLTASPYYRYTRAL